MADDAAFFAQLKKQGLGMDIDKLVREGEAERAVYVRWK
jgi:hypothetical protein